MEASIVETVRTARFAVCVTPNVCGTPCPLCVDIPQCDGAKTTVSGTAVHGGPDSPRPALQGARLYPQPSAGLEATAPCRRSHLQSMHTSHAGYRGDERHHRARWALHPRKRAGRQRVFPSSCSSIGGDTRRRSTSCPARTTCSPRARRAFRAIKRKGTFRSRRSPRASLDGLECVLRGMGIDDSEFTNPTGSGRIHFYSRQRRSPRRVHAI